MPNYFVSMLNSNISMPFSPFFLTVELSRIYCHCFTSCSFAIVCRTSYLL